MQPGSICSCRKEVCYEGMALSFLSSTLAVKLRSLRIDVFLSLCDLGNIREGISCPKSSAPVGNELPIA
jgi:hypothetical protein